MTNAQHSNISIASNIYVHSKTAISPFADTSFLSKVFERNALMKFPKNVRLTPMQERMKIRTMSCAYNNNVIPGVILKNGKYYTIIRCNKLATCKYSDQGKCHEIHEIS